MKAFRANHRVHVERCQSQGLLFLGILFEMRHNSTRVQKGAICFTTSHVCMCVCTVAVLHLGFVELAFWAGQLLRHVQTCFGQSNQAVRRVAQP